MKAKHGILSKRGGYRKDIRHFGTEERLYFQLFQKCFYKLIDTQKIAKIVLKRFM